MASNKEKVYEKERNIRFTSRIYDLVECKAKENNTSFSEIVRLALIDYLEKDIKDSELVYASLNDNKQKIRFLENKTELLAIFILEMVRRIIRVLPNRPGNSDELVELEFQRFLDDSALSLKKNHGGLLESMVLDIYQQQVQEGS